jgi:hypothetical protein
MTTIDPTALLARANRASVMTDDGEAGAVIDALLGAWLPLLAERDTLRAELERLTEYRDTLLADLAAADAQAADDVALLDGLTAEVTALRAALARMTGPDAVEAVTDAVLIGAIEYMTLARARAVADAAVRALTARAEEGTS